MEKFGDWRHTDVIEGLTTGSEEFGSFTTLAAGIREVFAVYQCWESADYSELEIPVAGPMR